MTLFLGIVALAEAVVIFRLLIRKKPYDGDLNITTNAEGGRTFQLELNDDPDYQVERKTELLFKVNKTSE